MAGAQLGTALRHIQHLFSDGSSTGLSDTQLLSRFAARSDETAFAALVARHGPMVLTVCRGILRDPCDTEDAFQATFLVLARKAGEGWAEGQLGGWLHKVASRIAVRASVDAKRRRRYEQRTAEQAVLQYTSVRLDDDWRPTLHEEIARLPAKFRLPIVFSYLDGLTQAEAARQLRCGEATLRRRLAGAREQLRVRLAHQGFAPSGAALGVSLANEAGAAAFAEATIRAVMRVAAGETMATVVSARVASLTQGGLTLITNGWKGLAFAALSLASLAGLAGGVGARDDRGGRFEAGTHIGHERNRCQKGRVFLIHGSDRPSRGFAFRRDRDAATTGSIRRIENDANRRGQQPALFQRPADTQGVELFILDRARAAVSDQGNDLRERGRST